MQKTHVARTIPSWPDKIIMVLKKSDVSNNTVNLNPLSLLVY